MAPPQVQEFQFIGSKLRLNRYPKLFQNATKFEHSQIKNLGQKLKNDEKNCTMSWICSRDLWTSEAWNWRISGAAFSLRQAFLRSSTSDVFINDSKSSMERPDPDPDPPAIAQASKQAHTAVKEGGGEERENGVEDRTELWRENWSHWRLHKLDRNLRSFQFVG